MILTDFPTRAGIPIPSFSQAGLGKLLVDVGLPKAWLSLNLVDGVLGILAVSEGVVDLSAALAGTLTMNAWTFVDTFVEGSVEVALGFATENPLLVVGGIENVLAGLIATWKTYTLDIDPFEVFGSALSSALFGAVLSYLLSHEMSVAQLLPQLLHDSGRSGTVGALFTLHSYFGFGALLGFAAYQLGKRLAEHHQQDRQIFFSINKNSFERLLKTLGEGDADFRRYWEMSQPRCDFLDIPPLLSTELTKIFRRMSRFLPLTTSLLIIPINS